MEIKYIDRVELINEKQLKGFFVGWPTPPTEKVHYKMLKKSTHVWIAIDQKTGNAVGFINAISDKTLAAYIPLLEVLPAYQGQGIGSKLVELMKDSLKDFYMVDVVCDEDVIAFYKNHQFVKGNSMMLRNYKHQSGIKK